MLASATRPSYAAWCRFLPRFLRRFHRPIHGTFTVFPDQSVRCQTVSICTGSCNISGTCQHVLHTGASSPTLPRATCASNSACLSCAGALHALHRPSVMMRDNNRRVVSSILGKCLTIHEVFESCYTEPVHGAVVNGWATVTNRSGPGATR